MPWKNKTFTPDVNFIDDKAQNKPFTAARLQQNTDDLAGGIADCLNVNGENQMKAILKMGGYKISGVGVGTNPTDVATVAQIGSIFATDQSTDATKIDLVQSPYKAVGSYKDGLAISFVVKNNSVNNMQLQINGLGYRNLDYAGLGSYIVGATKTVMYKVSSNSFVPKDADNQPLFTLNVTDFNDITNNCVTWVNGSTANNKPDESAYWGVLEVKALGMDGSIRQTFHAANNYIYTRVKENSVWTAWVHLTTSVEYDALNTKVDNLLALSKPGTKLGIFPFMQGGIP